MLLRVCPSCVSRGIAKAAAPVLSVFACALLACCAVGPDYQLPELPLPAKFAAMSSLKGLSDHNANRPLETTKWWRTLYDRELDSPIERAIGTSPTLEIALDPGTDLSRGRVSRLQQARAQEAVVIGAALPAAGFTAGGGWGIGRMGSMPVSLIADVTRAYDIVEAERD
jgi:outer membrane protein TolC